MTHAYVSWRFDCGHGPTCTCSCNSRLVPTVYVFDTETHDDDEGVRLEPATPRKTKAERVRQTKREQRRLWREDAFRRARCR